MYTLRVNCVPQNKDCFNHSLNEDRFGFGPRTEISMISELCFHKNDLGARPSNKSHKIRCKYLLKAEKSCKCHI
jgi:hypothetical protein